MLKLLNRLVSRIRKAGSAWLDINTSLEKTRSPFGPWSSVILKDFAASVGATQPKITATSNTSEQEESLSGVIAMEEFLRTAQFVRISDGATEWVILRMPVIGRGTTVN
jgi:hypothetical protein